MHCISTCLVTDKNNTQTAYIFSENLSKFNDIRKLLIDLIIDANLS